MLMWRFVWLAASISLAAGVKDWESGIRCNLILGWIGVGRIGKTSHGISSLLQDDLSATLDESLWFVADDHVDELVSTMRSLVNMRRDLHCIDLFGYSGKISKVWRSAGYSAEQYDVLRGGRAHDILSKRGFLFLMRSSALS